MIMKNFYKAFVLLFLILLGWCSVNLDNNIWEEQENQEEIENSDKNDKDNNNADSTNKEDDIEDDKKEEWMEENTPEYSYNWIDETGLWLKVSSWFTISIFAEDLAWARDLVWPDGMWNYLLSRTKQWAITMLTIKDWKVETQNDIMKNLNNPHWLVLGNDWLTLYYAETDKISKIRLYSDWWPEKLVGLPDWWRHYTRSLLMWGDWKLYVSIWSTCDVCYEEDERIWTIYSLNTDWTDFEQVATWLRNSVFMDLNPITWEIWATEMWRDNLGDNLPSDEINIIKKWNDYGWPICYNDNVHDTEFDKNQYVKNPCEDKAPPKIELQAHSAPLGLNFIPEEGWPEEYYNDLLVAYHGSWNRTIPTWYKLMHIKLDDQWNVQQKRDFIYWWLDDNNNVSGRVVDVLTHPWWIAYVTDDFKWRIYKITYNN